MRAPSRSRSLGLVLASALLVPALVTAAAPATAAPDVTRLSGADRYATAVAVSRSSHPNGAPVVVLTTGAGFADALAGGPAASTLKAPVLLVARDQVPAVVLDELRRLRPGRVLVLGGPKAVSDAVVSTLAANRFAVERLAGTGRYETAARVSQAVFPASAETVYVATGEGYADALAGAAAAGAAGAPILLVTKSKLPAATATELRRLAPRRIVVLGGTVAVAQPVETALRSYARKVSRIAGADRYATAAALSRHFSDDPTRVFLANGQGYADALTGGPAAAASGAPVLLVPPSCVPTAVGDEMARLGDPSVTLLGGVSALSSSVASLASCVRPVPVPVPVPANLVAIASGVSLSDLNDPAGPWKGKIVSVAPGAVAQLDAVLAQNALPGLETTSSMARRTGAIVAINGDYALAGGRPVHPFARNGRLIQTQQIFGRSLAVDSRASRLHMGANAVTADVTVLSTGQRAPISKVNSGASTRSAVALTTREAGPTATVPAGSCGVRIRPRSAPTLTAGGRSAQSYEVREVHCGTASLPPGEEVLTAPLDGQYAPLLRGLRPGQVVSVSWSVGWRDVLDSLGGNPALVSRGAVLAGNVDGDAPYFNRNPRTAVGYKADGTVLLVTVDGRGAGGSVGMTLRELAQLFVRLGATEAMGLDGGGSTTMVVNGQVRNTPSDGKERPVSSALVLLPASTAGSLAPAAAAPEPVALTDREQAAAARLAAVDPGSTGGLSRAYGYDLAGVAAP